MKPISHRAVRFWTNHGDLIKGLCVIALLAWGVSVLRQSVESDKPIARESRP